MTGTVTCLVAPLSRAAIEGIAEAYLRERSPQHLSKAGPLDVDYLLTVDILSTHQATLEIVPSLPYSKIEAETELFARRIRLPEVTYDAMVAGDARSRFTACHEVFHILAHSGQALRIRFQRVQQEDFRAYLSAEWQANYGAGCLLMPRLTFVPEAQRLLRAEVSRRVAIHDLAETYRVSLSAAEMRMRKLGL